MPGSSLVFPSGVGRGEAHGGCQLRCAVADPFASCRCNVFGSGLGSMARVAIPPENCPTPEMSQVNRKRFSPAGIGRKFCSALVFESEDFALCLIRCLLRLHCRTIPRRILQPRRRRGPRRLRCASWAQAVWRRRRLIAVIEAALLLLCLLYCLIAPNQYEADARVELRTAPVSSLSLEAQEPFASASVLSAPMALETLASVSAQRSACLARNRRAQALPDRQAFSGRFPQRFPGFNPDNPAPDAEAWLLDRFASRLHVKPCPTHS